jgi:peptide/nickel transport system permease protein
LVRHNPLGTVSLAILIALVLIAIMAPWIAQHNPERSLVGSGLKPPSATNWFGTDQLGRDVFSRVLVGSRVSLLTGLAVALLGTLLGTAIGIASGYLGGKTDLFVQRVMDSLSAFPPLVLAMLFMVVLGQSVSNVILALALANSPRVVRTVRAVVLGIKENEFILAARGLGATSVRVMAWHVLPNCLAPVLIMISAGFGWAILVESSLSFLGLGVPPNIPSWGAMLGGQAQLYVRTAPWTAVFPGLVLSVAVLAANLFGDTLRDILDPRLRER